MKHLIKNRHIPALAAALALTLLTSVRAEDAPMVTVGWVGSIGTMPFKLMQSEGLLDKRAKEYDVNVELREYKDRKEAIKDFTAGEIHGCTLTSIEALVPASRGTTTIAVAPLDTSIGGDGILVRKGGTFTSLKGSKVLVQEKSVGHYILWRGLDKNGLSASDITIVNASADDAGNQFINDESVTAAVTSNPHLLRAVDGGKGEVLFSTGDIPGEITDLLVFNEDTTRDNRNAVKAYVMAWYDAIEFMESKDTRDRALRTMSEAGGGTPEEWKKMMRDVRYYRGPQKATEFFTDGVLQSNMDKIREFSAKQGLISNDELGIGFTKSSQAPLRFTADFLAGASGKAATEKVEGGAKKLGNKIDRVLGRKESK